MNRRQFLAGSAAASVLLASGCQTMSISDIENQGTRSTSQETISAFMMTEDKQTLVVIGKDHHYIFPTRNNELGLYNSELDRVVELLSSPLRPLYEVFISNTIIYHGLNPSRVKTNLIIQVSDRTALTPKQQSQLQQLRLSTSTGFSTELKGAVYLANKETALALSATQTYKQYPIVITEYTPKTKDIVLSPIKSIAGGLMLGGLILITIPIIIISCRGSNNCWA